MTGRAQSTVALGDQTGKFASEFGLPEFFGSGPKLFA